MSVTPGLDLQPSLTGPRPGRLSCDSVSLLDDSPESRTLEDLDARVRATLALVGEPTIVMQPIITVSTGTVLAVEALARFPHAVDTEAVFSAAQAAGSGPALEAHCLRAALRLRTELPAGTLLAVNISPDALPVIAAASVWPDDLCGVIVEVTEQAVENPNCFAAQLDVLRARGAAIAIDDVSTGYAGLLRLAELRPDYVKIDRRVVAGVGDSVVQAAVLEALVTLSHRLGAAVIGEGVEDLADLGALGDFDVDYAQGYAVARPSVGLAKIRPAVVAACRASRRQLIRGSSVTGHAARTRDVYAVTATLAAAHHQHDVDVAIAATAADLDVDVIGVSILTSARTIREIATTEPTIDTTIYSLARYPATRAVLEGAETVEIQLSDPQADTAERVLMQRLGRASLLLVPIYHLDQAIGFLEFAQRTPRRWNAQDVAHAQGLAEHLGRALPRLGVGAVGVEVVAS